MNTSKNMIKVFLLLITTAEAFTFVDLTKGNKSFRFIDTSTQMGLIDDLKLIFSDEGKKNRAADDERKREEQEAALEKIRERRRNPDKMEEYETEVMLKRIKMNEEKAVYDFQRQGGDDYDPLNDWQKGREDGTIILGDDLERDPTTERLGSEGLQEVRVDERMPYIDRGYVAEDADIVGNFMKIFGGGKKDEDRDDEDA